MWLEDGKNEESIGQQGYVEKEQHWFPKLRWGCWDTTMNNQSLTIQLRWEHDEFVEKFTIVKAKERWKCSHAKTRENLKAGWKQKAGSSTVKEWRRQRRGRQGKAYRETVQLLDWGWVQEEGQKTQEEGGVSIRQSFRKNIAKSGFARYMLGEVSRRFNMMDSHPEENKKSHKWLNWQPRTRVQVSETRRQHGGREKQKEQWEAELITVLLQREKSINPVATVTFGWINTDSCRYDNNKRRVTCQSNDGRLLPLHLELVISWSELPETEAQFEIFSFTTCFKL